MLIVEHLLQAQVRGAGLLPAAWVPGLTGSGPRADGQVRAGAAPGHPQREICHIT
jgi:hypothetical protein